MRPLPRTLLCSLLLLGSCRDFNVPDLPAPPNKPVVEAIAPLQFFSGQRIAISGTLLDAGAGETPQIWLSNLEAVVVGVSTDGASGKQTATVEVPGGLPFDTGITVRVRTSAGEGNLASPARYLGPGHLPDRVDARSTKVGVNPWGLAVSETGMMVVDLWRDLINVFSFAEGSRTQLVALRVPPPGSAAATYERPTIDDVALTPDGGKALVSYWLPPAQAGGPGTAGLVALAPCTNGWTPTRHYQLAPGGGRLLRIVYGEVAGAFFVERSYGHGGLLTVPAASLPAPCTADTPLTDTLLALAPPPDATWPIGDLDEPLPDGETTDDPGMSISPDGTRLAVSRGFEAGSTVDVYDITLNPPVPARERLYDESLWIIDVVLYGRDSRLAVLDWNSSTILREASPPGSGWVDDGIQTAYIVTGMFRGDRDGSVLVATLDSLLEVDLAAGRATGSIAMPNQTVRALPAPGLAPLMYATVTASADQGGKLVTFNRDARVITDTWRLDYPVWRASFSTEMDWAISDSRFDMPKPFLAAPGQHFATGNLGGTLDSTSITAVTADRDMVAMAGKRRKGRADADFVRIVKLSSDPADVEQLPGMSVGIEKRPIYLSPTEGFYLGLVPYGTGVVALKRRSWEVVGTGACDRRGEEEWTLPPSCAFPLPAGWELTDSVPYFAVAQGTGELFLPQAVVEGGTTRVAARLPVAGGEPVGLSIAGRWDYSMVSVSRDGRLLSIAAFPPCPDASECPSGTAFWALEGAQQSGLQQLPFFAQRTSAVAVSPDATRIYVAQDNGRVYAVTPGPDGVNVYEDIRLLVTLTEGWLTSLSAAGDGASLTGTTDLPGSQIVVLQ